jgi:hypothetical protein
MEAIIYYETWASVLALHIVDITDVWCEKLEAIKSHRLAMGCGDYLRAIEGLNSYRGLYLGFNRKAEAFLVENPARDRFARRFRGLGLNLLKALHLDDSK